MITTSKWLAIVAIAFVAGSFIASPELRAYAANTVFSTDIKDGEVKTADLANNAVTSAKIKDGEVKTADIANGAVAAGRIADGAVGTLKIADESITAADIQVDAVGASELQGVSKLIFASCGVSISVPVAGGGRIGLSCKVPGTDSDDEVLVTQQGLSTCFSVSQANTSTDTVSVALVNACNAMNIPGPGTFSIIVYDT